MKSQTASIKCLGCSVFAVGGAAVSLLLIGTPALAHQIDPTRPVVVAVIPSKAAQKASSAEQAGAANAVVNAFKLWRSGSTLSVCFYGGSPDVKKFFVDTEATWARYAHVVWDFGDGPDYRSCDAGKPSHIRVSFDETGHWSRVGTDAIQKSVVSQASLNIDINAFGNFSLADKKMIRAVMLHEQGHALGLEHEHQSPTDPCISKINWQLFYAEMAKPPNQWDAAKVDLNLKALVDTTRLRVTDYDRASIMHYAFPARWFSDPSCAVSQNFELSKVDIDEVGQAYPQDAADQSEFINKSQARASEALASSHASPDLSSAVSADIKDMGSSLDPALARGAALVISVTGSENVLSGQSINIQSFGDQSPIVTNTHRDVTFTFGSPGQPK